MSRQDDAAHQPVRVEIAGEEHVLRTGADPRHTEACAARVDRSIREIAGQAPALDARRVAILAALNLADELIQSENQHEGLATGMTGRVEALTARIRAVLGDIG